MFSRRLDFKHGSLQSRYLARQTVQVLFDYYRENGGDLSNIYHLLCDVGILEQYFDKCEDFKLYWYFWRSSTYMYDFFDPSEDNQLSIIFDSNSYAVTVEEVANGHTTLA